MRSFHDYWLTGYSVNGEQKAVTFHLSEDPRGTEAPEKVDLLFSGLSDYFLEHDLGVNIVDSIEECEPNSFLTDHCGQFKENSKWGWPKFWGKDIESARAFLANNRLRVWGLGSSYGLSGWVVAEQVSERASIA